MAACLALFALAINFAWPMLAKASTQSSLTDICTAAGMQAGADGAGHSKPLGPAATHCGLCPFGAAKALFPPHDTLPAPAADSGGAPAGAEIRIPPISSVSPHPAPRAPPSGS